MVDSGEPPALTEIRWTLLSPDPPYSALDWILEAEALRELLRLALANLERAHDRTPVLTVGNFL
jgi:hypothetical protein